MPLRVFFLYTVGTLSRRPSRQSLICIVPARH